MSIILLMVLCKILYLNIYHPVFVSRKSRTKHNGWVVTEVFVGPRLGGEMIYLDIRSRRKIIVRVKERHDRGEGKNEKFNSLYNCLGNFFGSFKPISGKGQVQVPRF